MCSSDLQRDRETETEREREESESVSEQKVEGGGVGEFLKWMLNIHPHQNSSCSGRCFQDGVCVSYLSGHVSGEVAVWGELEVAAVPCGVVHHIYLSRLTVKRQKQKLSFMINTYILGMIHFFID